MKDNEDMIHHRILVMVMAISITKWSSDNALKLVLADDSGCRRAICVAKKHELKLVKGKKIFIKKFSTKDGTIYLKDCTTIFHGAGNLNIPQEIKERSEILLSVPVSPNKTVEEVLTSPVRSKVSFKGIVIGNEAVKTVTIKGKETSVKEIKLKDKTGEIRVSLWRDASSVDLNVGANVNLLESTVNYNSYYKCNILNVNYLDDIKIQPAESESHSIQIVGILNDSVDTEETLTVAIENENGQDSELQISRDLFIESLQLDCLSDVDEILSKLPISAIAEIKNDTIIQLNI